MNESRQGQVILLDGRRLEFLIQVKFFNFLKILYIFIVMYAAKIEFNRIPRHGGFPVSAQREGVLWFGTYRFHVIFNIKKIIIYYLTSVC